MNKYRHSIEGLLESLDGWGLILTDDDLIDEKLERLGLNRHNIVNNNFGMTVKLKLKMNWGNKTQDVVLNNVTEIHNNYQSCGQASGRTAFESDIQGTGVCHQNYQIIEMEVKPATEIAKEF